MHNRLCKALTAHLSSQPRVGPVRTETFSSVITLLIITHLSCVLLPQALFLATALSHLTPSLELYLTFSLTPAQSHRLIYFCQTQKSLPLR